MNWKPYVTSAASIGLAAFAGANGGAMNQPGSSASLLDWLLYCGLPLLGGVGSAGWGAVNSVALLPTQSPHLAPIGKQIGDAVSRGDFGVAQSLLSAVAPRCTWEEFVKEHNITTKGESAK